MSRNVFRRCSAFRCTRFKRKPKSKWWIRLPNNINLKLGGQNILMALIRHPNYAQFDSNPKLNSTRLIINRGVRVNSPQYLVRNKRRWERLRLTAFLHSLPRGILKKQTQNMSNAYQNKWCKEYYPYISDFYL